MANSKLLIGVVVLLMMAGRNKTTQVAQAQARAKYDYLHDPTTWGADQWARLYGDDLLPTDAPSPWDPYVARMDQIPPAVARRSGFNGTVTIDQKGY